MSCDIVQHNLIIIVYIGDQVILSDSKSLSEYYGTEFYQSPEVQKKHPRSKIDWRKTDIYACGVILFELCWIVPRKDREKVYTIQLNTH